MAEGQNIISLGFDIEKLGAEKTEVLNLLVDMFGQLEKYDGSKINPLGANGLGELKKSITDGAVAMDQLTEKIGNYNKVVTEQFDKQQKSKKATDEQTIAEREHAKILKDTEVTQVKATLATTEDAKARAVAKKELQEATQETNAYAKATLQTIGSINDAKASTVLLKLERDKLNAGTAEGAARIVAINEQINKNDALIKQNSSTLEKQKINIGNYGGAFKILEKSLEDVKKKMDDFTKSGKQDEATMEALAKEFQLLSTLVDAQSAGFKSATSEIKNNQIAILRLSQIYGEDSDVVKSLIKDTSQLQDTVADLKQVIKEQASDTKVFDGLINAAQGLAGAYSVAQGAAALFGSDNKALEETFVKLQAAMTVLQGLQAIQNVLLKESAARQLASLAIQRIQTIQTDLQTAAESKNILVKYAAIVAQKALNAAIAIGLGPIGIFLAIVGLLLVATDAFGASASNAAKSIHQLSLELEANAKFLEIELNAIKNNSKERIAELSSGFATERQLRERATKDQQLELEATKKVQDESVAAYNKARKLIDQDRFGLKKIDKDKLDDAYKIYNDFEALSAKRENLESDIRANTFNNARASAVEDAKLRRDSQQLIIDDAALRSDLFKRTAADETKTFAQRIAASSAYYVEQRRQIELQKAAALDNPELKEVDRLKVINDARIKSTLLLRDQEAAKRQLLKEENDRELQARNTISKGGREIEIAQQEQITADTKRSLEDRINALKLSVADKTRIIVDDYNLQLKLAREEGKTASEIQALAVEKNKALVDLTRDTQQQIFDITTSYGEKRLEQIAELNAKETSASKVETNYNADAEALNASLVNKDITYNQYIKKKRDLDRNFAIEQAAAQVKDDEAQLNRLQEFQNKELQIRLKAALDKLDIANAVGDAGEVAEAQRAVDAILEIQKKAASEELAISKQLDTDKKASSDANAKATIEGEALLASKKKELLQGSYELAKEFVTAGYEQRINQIQAEIDKSNEQAAEELKNVQASNLNQQDKANTITILTAQARTQETALRNEQKQEKIKEAKFNRDVAVAEVIWSTAKAIMKDTAGVPFPLSLAIAAADAAIGAVQVATILARPIPTYAEGIGIPGKGQHPGGLAWVGEEYSPEMVSMPGRSPFIVDKPTLIDMPAHTSVQPLNSDVMSVGADGILRGFAAVESRMQNKDESWNIARWQAAQMKKAFAVQRKIIVKVQGGEDPNWQDYYDKKIRGI